MCKNYAKFGHIGLPGNRRKKKQRELWCFNARSVTNHIVDIEEICKKICSGIGVLRRIRQFVPQGSLVTLYNSLIQPYFDYCSPLWDTCDKTLRNKLQILQNRAARVIIRTRYDDRIRSSDLLQSLG